MESARRVSLALVLAVTLSACGSSHTAVSYSGRLYSVAQVRAAFAQLGLELHQEASGQAGLVRLVNNRLLGPQRIPSPPRIVTVVVATERAAVGRSTSLPGQVTRYANVTVYSKGAADVGEVRAAFSEIRWGTPEQTKPTARGIVLGRSIGPIWTGEPRKRVEMTLGKGVRKGRGLVSYPRLHLLVSYAPHDTIVPWVGAIITRWSGFRGPAGVHVGSSRQDLAPLYVSCSSGYCGLQAGAMPDAPGTFFTLRRGKVVEIAVFAI